jgi:hypothetical protein
MSNKKMTPKQFFYVPSWKGFFSCPKNEGATRNKSPLLAMKASAIEGGVALASIIRVLILYSTPNHAGV